MPRTARIVVPGYPHHVTQRGNNRQICFRSDDDYCLYLHLLCRHTVKHDVDISGFCLMPNHVHLILTPSDKRGMATSIGRTHSQYARLFNRKHERSGHLWQCRYYSCVLDHEHMISALRYVDLNPVRSGLVDRAWDYTWSSGRMHCGLAPDPRLSVVLDRSSWERRIGGAAWKKLLRGAQDEAQTEQIRDRTFTGRPLGSEGFIETIEQQLGRSLPKRHRRARPT